MPAPRHFRALFKIPQLAKRGEKGWIRRTRGLLRLTFDQLSQGDESTSIFSSVEIRAGCWNDERNVYVENERNEGTCGWYERKGKGNLIRKRREIKEGRGSVKRIETSKVTSGSNSTRKLNDWSANEISIEIYPQYVVEKTKLKQRGRSSRPEARSIRRRGTSLPRLCPTTVQFLAYEIVAYFYLSARTTCSMSMQSTCRCIKKRDSFLPVKISLSFSFSGHRYDHKKAISVQNFCATRNFRISVYGWLRAGKSICLRQKYQYTPPCGRRGTDRRRIWQREKNASRAVRT